MKVPCGAETRVSECVCLCVCVCACMCKVVPEWPGVFEVLGLKSYLRDVVQLVECLSSVHDALGSIPGMEST